MQTKNIKKGFFRTGIFLWLVTIVFAGSVSATHAKVWLVGPGLELQTPSMAIKKAGNGDIIKILAGIYENDYAVINQDNLTIVGVNGFAHLKSSGPVPGGKAIWVINGNNVTVQNIEFSGARVPDKNGAGIRLQSGSLTVDNCYFHDNQMGLLTSGNAKVRLTIKNSEFNHNVLKIPQMVNPAHNVYVGAIDRFVMENSISRGAEYGHLVKSRARNTVIRNNRLFDEGDISASYLIDIPNGGNVLIENNYLYRNKGAQNNSLISYGVEGMKYSRNSLTIKYNTAINESGIAFLLRNHSRVTANFFENRTTNITRNEISILSRYGFLGRIKNKIREFLK